MTTTDDQAWWCDHCGREFPTRPLADACERFHIRNRDWE